MLTFASLHRHLNIGCFICNQFVVEGTSYSSPSCASRQTGQCFASLKSKADFRSSLKEKSSKTREGKLSAIELRTCSKAESFLFCWPSPANLDLIVAVSRKSNITFLKIFLWGSYVRAFTKVLEYSLPFFSECLASDWGQTSSMGIV